jgi:uncharacterized OsmC-like protein
MDNCKVPVKVKVKGESQSSTRLSVSSGEFNMIIDEPKQMGGSNQGPSPIQVLLMALAGCLNVTAHEVANQQNLPLTSLSIEIDGSLDACTFLGCSTENRAGFDSINVQINADFSYEVNQEIIDNWIKQTEIRCPVTDNIKSLTNISLLVN